MTDAELDDLQMRLRTPWQPTDGKREMLCTEAADALTALRRERDEARAAYLGAAEAAHCLHDANAQMAAALREPTSAMVEAGAVRPCEWEQVVSVQDIYDLFRKQWARAIAALAPAAPGEETHFKPLDADLQELLDEHLASAPAAPGLTEDQIMDAVIAAGKEAAKRGTAGREPAPAATGEEKPAINQKWCECLKRNVVSCSCAGWNKNAEFEPALAALRRERDEALAVSIRNAQRADASEWENDPLRALATKGGDHE